MQLVLGSTSPRRKALLGQLGLSFDIIAPDIDESVGEGENPQQYVARMSNAKHQAVVAQLMAPAVVVSADTVVVQDGDILGKPRDEAEGRALLTRLSGKEHRVLTSVTVGPGAETGQKPGQHFVIETIVRFRRLTKNEINAYWRTGEPQDKAGGYGIQGVGAILIDRINGSYTNVVGLPLTETAEALRFFDFPILE